MEESAKNKGGRPKKDPNAVNPAIDTLVNKALSKARLDDCPLKDMLEVIKVAAAWEKVKHVVKESEEGEFFKFPVIDVEEEDNGE